ncbi:MAG: glycosyl hydrolase family 18 [Lachnospiraceae bacterium]|nr:glycosyl hydrolase family 18 [Lachnospiraceae bacterium]
MKKRALPMAVAITIIIISIIVIVIGNIIEKKTPSKKHVSNEDLNKIYKLYDGYTEDEDGVHFENATVADENQVAILLQNELISERAVLEDGVLYLSYDFVKETINDKFYWDNNENILIYTTPTDIIKAQVGSQDYYITKVKNTEEYVIVKTEGDNVYIALDYVKKYSNIEYGFYENPNHLCITNTWNVTLDVATLKKDVKIRTDNSIKADILYSCKEDTEVTILESGKKWTKVITQDGYFGYVETESLSKKSQKTLTSDFVEPEYTRITKEHTISMAWHMVTGKAANSQLMDLITPAKGLNVISPTWYRLSDNEGNMTSLADSSYVTRAHLVGLEVWAMVDDQSPDSDNRQIFPYTSKREKIINQLIANAIEYDLDGINIDFEYITEDIADDYIQFIRELSVKCRINGIVLSVDNKVPEASNAYYNLEAQGEVVDYVIIMGYDEHWGVDSGSGSVASLPWVTQGIADTVEKVDSTKVINAIPFYTRIWEEDLSGNVTASSAVDMDTAASTLAAKGVTPVWVDNFGQNYGEYTEGETVTRIWLEDSESIEAKLKLIKEYNIAGVAAWRIGLENADLWNTIIKYTN